MDPIKNLISGSDPLRNDPAAMPDAEAALGRATSGVPIFTDSLPPDVLRFEDRKRRRVRVAGVLTIAAAAVTPCRHRCAGACRINPAGDGYFDGNCCGSHADAFRTADSDGKANPHRQRFVDHLHGRHRPGNL
jgi:hypothetical protein